LYLIKWLKPSREWNEYSKYLQILLLNYKFICRKNAGSPNNFYLVSSVQKSLSFSFLHFLCIFSEDDATLGKEISRPNLSFFRFHSRKKQENKGDWQGFFFTKREEKGQNMLKNKGFWQG